MRDPWNDLYLRMPPPSLGGIVFNLLMLAAPFIGLWLGGWGGLLIGLSISCIGLGWFFFWKPRHGLRCEICMRPVINFGRGSLLAEQMGIPGTLIRVSTMHSGVEGPGDECLRCGRVYCTSCAQFDAICNCGSRDFRTVRLRYKL
jgi:hypothetical protein